MSEEPDHGATTIRASKGGGGLGKWLLSGAAALVLLGGGYFVWASVSGQNHSNLAYNDPYAADPLRAGPLEPDENAGADITVADESAALPASTQARAAPARRSPARVEAVPEATIGVTPVNAAATTHDDGEIIVEAPRRPVWARTPSARRLSALYPARALERGREGEASLYCLVADGGALDCEKVSETPGGFGNAALRVARTFRHAEQLPDGRDAAGTPVNLRVMFRIDDNGRGRRYASN